MNKKATVILLSASLAFIIATVMLINGVKTVNVLGSAQMNLFSLQKEGYLYLAYIDNSAKFSLAETMKTAPLGSQDFYTLCKNNNAQCKDISQYFGQSFKKYLDSFNGAYDQKLDLNSYNFSSKLVVLDNKLGIELIGVSTDNISIKKGEDITYFVSPNFKIRADLEDLNKLATTPETIAITFFNELVNKFQKCLEQNKEKDTCFCDQSEINPGELPEGYKVSIITTAEKEKLFGGVEYQFKLLDKGNSIVMYGRGQQIRTLKGIFGAYEYAKDDAEKNLCYPGAFSKINGYVFGNSSEKGKLYSFSGGANCKGVSAFNMVEFVKGSDFGKLNKADCSKIGIKS